MGAEVSGLQLYREGATAAADSAEGDGAVQGASSGNDATDKGREPGGDGGRSDRLSARLAWILWILPNALGARRP